MSQTSHDPAQPPGDDDVDHERDEERDEERAEERVDGRAELLPEELAAGSDDPEAQAAAILEESDERTEHPEETQQESVQSPDVDRSQSR
jgi:hypothetical protein